MTSWIPLVLFAESVPDDMILPQTSTGHAVVSPPPYVVSIVASHRLPLPWGWHDYSQSDLPTSPTLCDVLASAYGTRGAILTASHATQYNPHTHPSTSTHILIRSHRRRCDPAIPTLPFMLSSLHQPGTLPGLVNICSQQFCDCGNSKLSDASNPCILSCLD